MKCDVKTMCNVEDVSSSDESTENYQLNRQLHLTLQSVIATFQLIV